ncbi:MAG: alpha/beta fold hydrolase [Verrucomicrobiaceae bacterium]|nr:alpha/beta fold hydrolase [Verrucomicrobiaceae bacterium]
MRLSSLVLIFLTPVLTHAQAPARMPAPAAATGAGFKLEAAVDRKDAIFKKGEPVSVTITLTKDGRPVSDAEVTWTFSKDGLPPYGNGKAMLKDGKAKATAKLDDPGFLQCRASFRETPTSAPITALAGAGIEPLEIKPSMPRPDDFDAFWAAQKKKLAAVPMTAKLTKEKSPSAKVEVFDAQVDCLGKPVSGYFARPAGAKPKSLPIILTVHGAGVSSSNMGSPVGWAGNGALAMDLNAHGIPNGKPADFYKSLSEGDLKDYRTAGRESRDTIYFLGMFLRLVRAIDFLTSQPEWNGKDVIVYGSSQGGFQAFAAAGIDERVTVMCAGVPAGCDHTGVVAKRVNGWPKFIPSLPVTEPDPKVLEAVRYFDNVNFAAHTHAKEAIVTVGFIDTTCPPTSVYAAYNALPIKKQIFNDVKSGHANTPAAIKAMMDVATRVIKAAAQP